MASAAENLIKYQITTLRKTARKAFDIEKYRDALTGIFI